MVVRDYDEALAFFTVALRFSVVEDTPLDGGDKRWGGGRRMDAGRPCSWPGRPHQNSWRTSATKPAAASPSSRAPTTSRVTTGTYGNAFEDTPLHAELAMCGVGRVLVTGLVTRWWSTKAE